MNRYRSPREGSRRARVAEERGLGQGVLAELECGKYRGLIGGLRRVRPFKWNLVSLWRSRNDRVARQFGDPTNALRARWLAWIGERRGAALGDADLLVRLGDGERASCLIIGDPGEGDASQCAVVPQLLAAAPETSLLFICSDVIYPAGDSNDYPQRFYEPYAGYDGPVFAVPGNHDWYDELQGFMLHLCGVETPPREFQPARMSLPARLFWRRPRRTSRSTLEARDRLRPPGRPLQPAPYLAVDLGPLLLVGIDTGIEGNLDRAQGEWLLRVSATVDKPKVLLTGKPIYVDGTYRPGTIAGLNHTVDDVVREPAHHYVAVIGGDIHNYQRYPVHLADGRTMVHIVSGGGGAFMHATHRIPEVNLDGVTEDGTDPDRETGDGFRCFPLRGDSIAFYSRAVRRGLRQLFRDNALLALGSTALTVLLLLLAGIHWWTIELSLLILAPAALALTVLAGLVQAGGLRIAFGRIERLTGEEGSAWIAQALEGKPTLAGPTELPADKARVAELIFPRFRRIRGLLHTFFSEIMDIDQPPLYKQFLKLEVADAKLAIRCYAAIGIEREGERLALEDEVVIDLDSA